MSGDGIGGAEVLVLAAHPDDETIGAAGLLHRRSGCVVHLTDGAPRDGRLAAQAGYDSPADYARARRRELRAALSLLGIGPRRHFLLGAVDQEAAWHMPALARMLATLVRTLRPRVLLTHPYEGGHPDHDAAALVGRAAVELVRAAGGPAPALVEMTSYHDRDGQMEVARFLPVRGLCHQTLLLRPEERRLKRRMIGCFRSQRQMLELFPVGWERFRPAPRYDFREPPHAGPLFYERMGWGPSGERFRRLADSALSQMGLAG